MYRKHGEPPTSGTSKIANAEPASDDGQEGGWPRKRLVEMDRKFRQRVERAIERGAENQEGAIGDYPGDRQRPAKELRSARGGRQDAARLNAGIHQRGRS